jgi:hypothetical protein
MGKQIKKIQNSTLEKACSKAVTMPPNIVPNPTERLDGLAKGVKLKGPIKQELMKATAARVTEKLLRAKQ